MKLIQQLDEEDKKHRLKIIDKMLTTKNLKTSLIKCSCIITQKPRNCEVFYYLPQDTIVWERGSYLYNCRLYLIISSFSLLKRIVSYLLLIKHFVFTGYSFDCKIPFCFIR